MERRTFVRGAFGLIALAAAGGLAKLPAAPDRGRNGFVTPEVASPEIADGPVMEAGIELVEGDVGTWGGWFGNTHLFDVDERGARLMCMADGSRTIDDLAASLETPADPADVASFFVTLGQAGYLQNTVMVNLVEIPT